jgi:hypothetical protein
MENAYLKIDFQKLSADPRRLPGLYYRIDFDDSISNHEGNEITHSLESEFRADGVLVFAQWGLSFMEGFFDNTQNIDNSKIREKFEFFVKNLRHKIVKCTYTNVETGT